MNEPEKWVLESVGGDEPPTEATPEQPVVHPDLPDSAHPTIPLPVEPKPESLYDTVKRATRDGILEALQASKDVLIEIVTAGLQGSQTIDKGEEEPFIGYRERYNRLKFIFRLIPLVFVGLVVSVVLVIVSGHVLATTAAIVLTWAIVVVSRIIIDRRLSKYAGINTKALQRAARVGWVIGSLVLAVILGVYLISRGVNPIFLFVYAIVIAVLLYLAAREHYKWAALWIYREDVFLFATRPASNRFFLKEFYEKLMLQKLDNAKMTPSFIEGLFKIGRVFLNVPGDEDKYWNELFFIVEPQQLIDAASQGSKQAKQ